MLRANDGASLDMNEQRTRSLKILAAAQAAIGALVAVVMFARFGLKLTDPSLITTSYAAGVMGTLGLVYYGTIHLVLGRKRLAFSTLVLTVITALNVILVIAATGGLDSPYYSLWLLAIVVAGIFGRAETIIVLVMTLAYYVYAMLSRGFNTPYLRDHLVQLVITLAAAALAEWVHSRNRKATDADTKLQSLSGELSAEQLKADAIISSIGEGVMVIDATRRIKLFNKAAQELTGWDESSAENIDCNLVLQLKSKEDKPLDELTDPFAQSWKSGQTVNKDELFMTTRAGRKIQLSLSVSPMLNAQNQPNGAIALFRDISKEKEVERQKEEFISTASHEMRTPVAAIEGYMSLAMNPNVATIDERAKKYLDKAHEAIAHLGDLFRDLLSVTKAEEGSLESQLEPVNMAELLQGTTDDMRLLAQNKNLTLVYQIGGQSGKAIAPLYYVAANPERLREVVMNLIDNGIKFTGQGGLRVTLEGNDKEVTVGITDTGLGIAQEDIPHLFQKFYRVDSSDTRTIGGTGLGLYLCRRIIELFNGRIWIESKLGEGSSFKFTLPRLSQDEVTRMQSQIASANAGPGTSQATAGTVVEPHAPTPAPAPAPVSVAVVSSPVPGQDESTTSTTPTQPASGNVATKVPVSINLSRRVQ
jgi:PAS domain S-box-containing protein